jgi:alkylhydroperoxidase family enzyme
LGVDEATFDQLVVSIDAAPIEETMKPLLHYVQKLTRTPSEMTADDVEVVRAAGWSEDAIFDAICICGFANLMNRVVDAVGIEGTEEEHRESGRRLSSIGYDATMAKALEGLAQYTPT